MDVSTCAGLMVYTFTPSVFSAVAATQHGQSSDRHAKVSVQLAVPAGTSCMLHRLCLWGLLLLQTITTEALFMR